MRQYANAQGHKGQVVPAYPFIFAPPLEAWPAQLQFMIPPHAKLAAVNLLAHVCYPCQDIIPFRVSFPIEAVIILPPTQILMLAKGSSV